MGAAASRGHTSVAGGSAGCPCASGGGHGARGASRWRWSQALAPMAPFVGRLFSRPWVPPSRQERAWRVDRTVWRGRKKQASKQASSEERGTHKGAQEPTSDHKQKRREAENETKKGKRRSRKPEVVVVAILRCSCCFYLVGFTRHCALLFVARLRGLLTYRLHT